MTTAAFSETRIVTKRLHDRPDDSWTIDGSIASGGYESLQQVLRHGDPGLAQAAVTASGLRGRGGANFATGQKWSFLPKDSFPRYLVVNGDEGEPSTFKDRMLIERDPHQLVEGIVIAAYAIECHLAFIYCRGEFALGYDRLVQAIADARAKGYLGQNILGSGFDLDIVVHRGAGAYICGEETALLESLEGERGMPRLKPPFPAIEGLYAKPTVVNNVETLSTLPHIVAMGGEEYAKIGVARSTGTRICSLSGHVKNPGNYEVAYGCTFRDIIYGLGGGIRDDRELKFFLPGGASFQWLLPQHLDEPYDMDHASQQLGTSLGSGALMVYDETTDPVRVAWRLAKFYSHESCGKCTPCREGTGWIEKVLYRMLHGWATPEDFEMVCDVADNISPNFLNAPFNQTTLCPLGPSVASPIASLTKYFKDEIMERLAADAARAATADATATEVPA
jgi:NADH-quinone oxidoreductase subunit F